MYLVTMILAYALFVVLAYAYFFIPAPFEQAGSGAGGLKPRVVKNTDTKETKSNTVLTIVATKVGFKLRSTF